MSLYRSQSRRIPSFFSPLSLSLSSSSSLSLSPSLSRSFQTTSRLLLSPPHDDPINTYNPDPSEPPLRKSPLYRSRTKNIFETFMFTTAGEYKHRDISREELQTRFGLHARDIIMLHSDRFRVPSTLPRDNCILVNIEWVQALISKNHVFLFNIENPVVAAFAVDIQHYLRENSQVTDTAFELRALDAMFSSIIDRYTRRMTLFSPVVRKLVDRLVGTDHSENMRVSLRRLLPLQQSIQAFESHLQGMQNMYTGILHNDEDMLEVR